MNLNFSNKGLLTFDASCLRKRTERSADASHASSADDAISTLLESAPSVTGIDLSHNAIHMFVGGEVLVQMVLLNLSHNALSVLSPSSLPRSLVRLDVAHNSLSELGGLGRHTPALLELDISHNAFTAAGLRGLPASLTTLRMRGNDVASLDALRGLRQLVSLSAGQNSLPDVDSVAAIAALPSLRQLELRDNPLMRGAAVAQRVGELAPRLATLNGQPLSQAAGNAAYRAKRAAAAKQMAVETSQRGPQRRRSSAGRSRLSSSGVAEPQPPVGVRLMEAKVAELRRLVAESEAAENQQRYERGVLADQIRSCAGVIESQERAMDELRGEVAALREEEGRLRSPIAAAEQTFQRTHASLIAHRASALGGGGAPPIVPSWPGDVGHLHTRTLFFCAEGEESAHHERSR